MNIGHVALLTWHWCFRFELTSLRRSELRELPSFLSSFLLCPFLLWAGPDQVSAQRPHTYTLHVFLQLFRFPSEPLFS